LADHSFGLFVSTQTFRVCTPRLSRQSARGVFRWCLTWNNRVEVLPRARLARPPGWIPLRACHKER
jgi:hypothetical protein